VADFCKDCAEYHDFRNDAAGLTSQQDWDAGMAVTFLCEGCGPVFVAPDGSCGSEDCGGRHRVDQDWVENKAQILAKRRERLEDLLDLEEKFGGDL
jgi:hypothetical protein